MSAADWRSAGAYEELRLRDAPAFAFEFLRRNPEFRTDHARLLRKSRGRPLNVEDADAFAERWGVRFRTRAPWSSRNSRAVDTQGASERRYPDKDHRRIGQS